MSLSGEQFGELTEILCETFDWDALDQLVRVRFSIELSDEVATKATPLRTVATKWINWLEQRERIAEFLGCLRGERPNVERVRRFCDTLQVATRGANGTADAGAAVRRFVEQFHEPQRQDQFRYLNAYKELHDVLHELQSNRPRID